MTASPLTPVIIASAVPRAGTTLVQRLLCSAGNALIYGDTVGQQVDFLARYAAVQAQFRAHIEPTAGAQRAAVRAGHVDDFITSLTPEPAVQERQWQAAAVAWLAGCRDEAGAFGRDVWGWKLAGMDGTAVRQLAAWLPQARWIWVHREAAACFQSAKAAGMGAGPDDARQFRQMAEANAAAWATVMAETGAAALHLDYAAMTADPCGTVAQLEAFTGARGIAADVFHRKINAVGGACVAPLALTDDETAAFATETAAGADPDFKASAA